MNVFCVYYNYEGKLKHVLRLQVNKSVGGASRKLLSADHISTVISHITQPTDPLTIYISPVSSLKPSQLLINHFARAGLWVCFSFLGFLLKNNNTLRMPSHGCPSHSLYFIISPLLNHGQGIRSDSTTTDAQGLSRPRLPCGNILDCEYFCFPIYFPRI